MDTVRYKHGSIVLKAAAFAARAHRGMKYGDEPYMKHLADVADLCEPYGETVVAAAYLHDVVEDTEVTSLEIWEEFGDPVAALVWIVTDPSGKSRKDRKARLHGRLKDVREHGHYDGALIVKVADRLASVSACKESGKTKLLKMYAKEHKAFREAAYKPDVCDLLWEKLEAFLEGV